MAFTLVRNNAHPIGNAEQCIGNIIGAVIEKGSVDRIDTTCAPGIPPIPFFS